MNSEEIIKMVEKASEAQYEYEIKSLEAETVRAKNFLLSCVEVDKEGKKINTTDAMREASAKVKMDKAIEEDVISLRVDAWKQKRIVDVLIGVKT